MGEQFDYIICGAGLAGLSLAYRLSGDSYKNKNILLLDKDKKDKNDRTWCFWDEDQNLFDSIVYKSWDRLDFFSNKGKIELNISPYRYKMIRGIDFYSHCLQKIHESPNIQIRFEAVQDLTDNGEAGVVRTDKQEYLAKYVFNSAIREKIDKKKCKYVDQHFKGWIIETEEEVFDSEKAIFMDFRIDQNDEARFFYVLPTSNNQALVEVAIFSNTILEDNQYDQIISDYISKYIKIEDFEIVDKEFGVIPMTNNLFKRSLGNHVFNFGTSGGAVKPSSGYAFKRIQEQCDDLVEKLKKGEVPILNKRSLKYHFLDSVLLNVVETNKCSSAEVFHRLFDKHKASLVFKFLDEKTSLLEDLKIISAPPVMPFLKAAREEIFW